MDIKSTEETYDYESEITVINDRAGEWVTNNVQIQYEHLECGEILDTKIVVQANMWIPAYRLDDFASELDELIKKYDISAK